MSVSPSTSATNPSPKTRHDRTVLVEQGRRTITLSGEVVKWISLPATM